MQAGARRGLAILERLAGAAGNTDVKCDGHRPFLDNRRRR
jgi:hypothetical protein